MRYTHSNEIEYGKIDMWVQHTVPAWILIETFSFSLSALFYETFLYETKLRSDLCDIKLYMAGPTAVQMEGFGILFIPLSANFFRGYLSMLS